MVGRGPGRYNLYLGAAADGTRLNKLYRRDVEHDQIVALLTPLLGQYARERAAGERFGDFVIRTGHIAATTAGNRFHLDLDPALVPPRSSYVNIRLGQKPVDPPPERDPRPTVLFTPEWSLSAQQVALIVLGIVACSELIGNFF